MPYYTGTVTSLAGLRTALINACVSEGWTNVGNVVHKNGCYASLVVGNTNEESGAPPNCRLIMWVGNGIDGSNNLTDPAGIAGVRIGFLRAADNTYPEWDWPVAYHLHIMTDPDEVYLFVNYGAGQFWQQLAWGQSPAEGNVGTGNWMYGTLPRHGGALSRYVDTCAIEPNGARLNPGIGATFVPAPFFWDAYKGGDGGYYDVRLNAQIHGCIKSSTGLPVWSDDFYPLGVGDQTLPLVSSGVPLQPLMTVIPNAWNQEVVLLPCQIFQSRPDAKISLIGELQHLRFTRNTYILPGEIVQLGPERWKVYPCYRRNADVPDGGEATDHSGTIAMAIRYDGP